MHLLAAPDKFRGTASAAEVAAAIAEAASATGHTCQELPLADGGEGLLEVFGGANRTVRVTGPLGEPVQAQWRLDPDGRAIIESAQACGLVLAGGAGAFDPMTATTAGVGELIALALSEGARKIILGLGGSATTDGGQGAITALQDRLPLVQLRNKVTVCCDVSTRFEQAATVFGPQKGATGSQISLLEARLTALIAEYDTTYGVDVSELVGAGAAGGLAGGLAAMGASLVSGFDAIADALNFNEGLLKADLVVTGEGRLDATSFRGKVVGGVLGRAAAVGIPVFVVAGQVEDGAPAGVDFVSLSDLFGQRRSLMHTTSSVKHAVMKRLSPEDEAPPVLRRRLRRKAAGAKKAGEPKGTVTEALISVTEIGGDAGQPVPGENAGQPVRGGDAGQPVPGENAGRPVPTDGS